MKKLNLIYLLIILLTFILISPLSTAQQECVNDPFQYIYEAGATNDATNLKPIISITWDRPVSVIEAKLCEAYSDISQYVNCNLGSLEENAESGGPSQTYYFQSTQWLGPSKSYAYVILVKDEYGLCSYAFHTITTANLNTEIGLYDPPLGGTKVIPNNLTINLSQGINRGEYCKFAFNNTLPESCEEDASSPNCFESIADNQHFDETSPNGKHVIENNFFNTERFPSDGTEKTILVVCNQSDTYPYNIFRTAYYKSKPTITWSISPNPLTDVIGKEITLSLNSNHYVFCNYTIKNINNDFIQSGVINNANINDGLTYFKSATNKIRVNAPSSGDYNFTLHCQDLALNTYDETKTLKVQYAQQVKITSIRPAKNDWQNSTEVNVSVTTNLKSNCNISYDQDTFDMEPTESTTHWVVIDFEEGKNKINVSCHDTGGLGTSIKEEHVVSVDTTAPEQISLELARPICDPSSIYVKIKAYDELSGIDSFSYRILNSSGDVLQDWATFDFNGNGTYLLPAQGLEANKTYSLEIVLTDKAGNSAEASSLAFDVYDPSEIVCDYLPPDLEYNLTNMSSGEVQLNLSCNDSGSGCLDSFFIFENVTNLSTLANLSCNFTDLENNFDVMYYSDLPITYGLPTLVCIVAQDLAGNNATLELKVVPLIANMPDQEEFCNNGRFDQAYGETDIDCGGPCDACQINQSCSINSDCASGLECYNATCVMPTCDDGRMNGNETDIDCGGSCNACSYGQSCNEDIDCVGNLCYESTCLDPEGDEDQDDLSNYEEVREYFTNPYSEDSDGDGYFDGEEVKKGSDPLDEESIPKKFSFNIVLVILFIIVALALASYMYFFRYKKKEGLSETFGITNDIGKKQKLGSKTSSIKIGGEERTSIEGKREKSRKTLARLLAEERHRKKNLERKKLFEAFETSGKESNKFEEGQKKKEVKVESSKKDAEKRDVEEKISEYNMKEEKRDEKEEDVFEKLRKFVKDPKKYVEKENQMAVEEIKNKLGLNEIDEFSSVVGKKEISIDKLKDIVGRQGFVDTQTLKVLLDLLMSSNKLSKEDAREFINHLLSNSLISRREYEELLKDLEM